MMPSAESVKELRAKTGAGIMECKKALQESGGDLEGAIEFLRKQGTVKAAKKATRQTKEGLIAIAEAGAVAAVIELNCETDFVARTDEFRRLAQGLAGHVAKAQPDSVESCLVQKFSGDAGKTVDQVLKEAVAKLGENITLARFEKVSAIQGSQQVGSYLHAGSQIGVLVKLKGDINEEARRGVAMHIAAMHPLYVAPDAVPAELAKREQAVLKAADDLAGKPPAVVEKMIAGRYKKFLADTCLTEQPYIRDPEGKRTVQQFLQTIDSQAGVLSFIRFQVGAST